MAAIVIKDLEMSKELDKKALMNVRGGKFEITTIKYGPFGQMTGSKTVMNGGKLQTTESWKQWGNIVSGSVKGIGFEQAYSSNEQKGTFWGMS